MLRGGLSHQGRGGNPTAAQPPVMMVMVMVMALLTSAAVANAEGADSAT